jgi:hypothetical protein
VTWTTTKPVAPGFYGLVEYRTRPGVPQPPAVVKVEVYADGSGQPHAFWPGSDCPVYLSDIDPDSLWCGPIVLPPVIG